ncbi:MAG: hypothetical protein K0S70_4548 [Microbacterium sp.]|jgi:putative ABC transport system permease protein|nr:hypothetical protein [Microbacterium sp.]
MLVRTGLATLLLTAVAVLVLAAGGIRGWWSPTVAIARAGMQLAALSLVLGGIIGDPVWVGVGLCVMFAVAVAVSTRRAGEPLAASWRAAVALGIGVGVAGGSVFLTGAVACTPRYLLAVGAMVIGNAMTVSSLAGRRFAQLRADRWAEVEGWLALGATPRRATRDLGRIAVYDALVPGIDQTKTTGLVVLPGAFVGAVFGGLSPLEAGRFQLVVLAAILAAGAITATITVSLTSGRMWTAFSSRRGADAGRPLE